MEWRVAMYLLSDEYPLHFLDIGADVGVVIAREASFVREWLVSSF